MAASDIVSAMGKDQWRKVAEGDFRHPFP